MSKKQPAVSPQQLRDVAEAELVRVNPLSPAMRPAAELVHEIQVHQIELEMQNEALRQVQAELENSRDRYVDLYEFAPVGYMTLSCEGRITAINMTGAALLGEDRSTLLHRQFSSLVLSEDIDRWHAHFLGVFRAASETTCELNLMRQDGTVFTAGLVCAWAGTADTSATVRVTVTDISDRRLATLQLAEAHERLEKFSSGQATHLRELAIELTHAEQHERERLHSLLHDDMQPLLVAARLSLSGINSRTRAEDSFRIAKDVIDHISHVIAMARNLSLELSPPMIREHGLNAALDAYCRWMKATCGLEVDLTPAPDAEPDSPELRLACFNAVRELLVNVVKHAGVADATLTLQRIDDGAMCIILTDRGCGFDRATAVNGTGIPGIRRRLGMFGGELQIDTLPRHGTAVTLWVPLRLSRTGRAGFDRRGRGVA